MRLIKIGRIFLSPGFPTCRDASFGRIQKNFLPPPPAELSELLGISKNKIMGVVCFMGDAQFKTGIQEDVFLEGRSIEYIKSFKTPVFSSTEVVELIQRIESGRQKCGYKTNRAHIKRLRYQRAKVGQRTPTALTCSIHCFGVSVKL